MKPAREGLERYDYVVDPRDLYVIWDRISQAPHMANGELLAFRTQEAALEVLDLLNDPSGRDADQAAPAGGGAP